MLSQRLALVILMVVTILCMAPANCEQPGSEVKCTPDCTPEPVYPSPPPPPPVTYPPPPECPPPPSPPVLPPPSPPVEPPPKENCPPPPPTGPFSPPWPPIIIFGPPGELYPVDPNHMPSSSRRNLVEALPVSVAGGLVLLALWSTH